MTIICSSDLNMAVLRTLVRAQPVLHPFRSYPQPLLSASQCRFASGTSDWSGRQPQEHVSNRKDELDVQSGASQSGKRERATDDENASQGTSEKDSGNQNEQAKKDHPEAPGPVIGMNDERGGVSLPPSSDRTAGLLIAFEKYADDCVEGPQGLKGTLRVQGFADWPMCLDCVA